MKKSGITELIIFFLVLAMIWLFTTTPFGSTKENALWNILVISSVLTFFLYKRGKEIIEVKSGKEFLSLFTSGAVLGIFITYAIQIIVSQSQVIWNLFGTISFTQLASMTTEYAFWSVVIQPLSETILLVPVLLFTIDFFKKVNFGVFSVPVALIVSSAIFASLHFVAIGAGEYEYSITGFFNFVGSPTGAFPQMLMGFFWGMLLLGFRSWVPVFSAHVINNMLAYFSVVSFSNAIPIVIYVGIVVGMIVLVSIFSKKSGLLTGFSLKNIYGV